MIMLLSGPSLESYLKAFKAHFPKELKVIYVPSWYGNRSKSDYNRFKSAVSVLKWDTTFFPVDKILTKKDKEIYAQADLVVIDGGNTFFLSHHLKTSGLSRMIKTNPPSHLIGLSAGAIALTPSIRMAKYPDFTADENFVGLTNMTGLGLVDFELHVHATNNKKELDQVSAAAKRSKTKRTIEVLKDGDYLLVKEDGSMEEHRKLRHIKISA